MALSFFGPLESDTKDLDFLDDWLKENPKNKRTEFPVSEIILVRSGKGYMVKTDCFIVFLWKKAAQTAIVLEALQHYLENPQDGRELVVVLNKKAKNGFQLAANLDKEITWFSVGNGFSTNEQDAILPESNGENPLIPGTKATVP